MFKVKGEGGKVQILIDGNILCGHVIGGCPILNLYYGQFPVAHINFEEYLATRLVGTELIY